MKTRPDVSDDEIRKYMDFEKILAAKNADILHAKKTSRVAKVSGFIAICILLATAAWWLAVKPEYNPTATAEEGNSVPDQRPKSLETDTVETLEPKKTETETAIKQKPQKSRRNPAPKPSITAEMGSDTSQSGTLKEKIPPVYVQAEPRDGYPQLYEYFSRELTYPVESIADSVEGVVTIAFTINASGRPEKISVEQSLGPAFDEEAIRLIEKMPDWKPATYASKPVLSRLSLPITFQIKRIKTKH